MRRKLLHGLQTVFVCDQLENDVSDRESKKSLVYPNDISGKTESSSLRVENLVTETTHNG